MKRIFMFVVMLISASFLFTSCGAPVANNAAANKPANNSAANTAAAPAVDLAAVEADVKKLVNETAAALAKNDVAALEKTYSDNYMLVNLDGSIQSKADRLASFRSGDTKFESFAYDEVSVRTNPEGTGAVVIARATAKGMNKGKPVASNIRVTQVWSKTKDGWRQVSGHATPITAAEPAKTNTANTANTAKPPPPAPANK